MHEPINAWHAFAHHSTCSVHAARACVRSGYPALLLPTTYLTVPTDMLYLLRVLRNQSNNFVDVAWFFCPLHCVSFELLVCCGA